VLLLNEFCCYFVIDSVRKLLVTSSYITYTDVIHMYLDSVSIHTRSGVCILETISIIDDFYLHLRYGYCDIFLCMTHTGGVICKI